MNQPKETYANRHFIIYKPYGYLSQFVNNQHQRRNKKLLGELYNFPEGTMSIGRLDQKSEGLLFLTTNGRVSDQVRSKEVEKEYYIQVDGLITQEAITKLEKGVEIRFDRKYYTTLPAKARILNPAPKFKAAGRKRGENHGPTSWASITISEGKYRQVRKMSAAVVFPVLRLIRVRIGNISLFPLEAGEIIEVDEFDLHIQM